jgi:outer membrane lipoprotein-sorting protein
MPENVKSCLKAVSADMMIKLLRVRTQLIFALSCFAFFPFTAVEFATAAQIPLPPVRPAEYGRTMPLAPPSAPPQTVPPAVIAPVVPEITKPLSANTPPALVLQKVNAALNALPYFSAYFTQLSGNHQSDGQVYVLKPGKLRFDYDPPVPTEIIADGSSVAVRDTKMATQDIYPIGQTPLKFLTHETVDLARDFKVTGVRVEPDRVLVSLEDKATFAGTSKITLFFEQPRLLLKQWIVIDPQGVEISVVLNGINTTTRPDPKIFEIDFLRYRQ